MWKPEVRRLLEGSTYLRPDAYQRKYGRYIFSFLSHFYHLTFYCKTVTASIIYLLYSNILGDISIQNVFFIKSTLS